MDEIDEIRREISDKYDDQASNARTAKSTESKNYHSALADGLKLALEIVNKISPKVARRHGIR